LTRHSQVGCVCTSHGDHVHHSPIGQVIPGVYCRPSFKAVDHGFRPVGRPFRCGPGTIPGPAPRAGRPGVSHPVREARGVLRPVRVGRTGRTLGVV
jgi:hypothetical protein